MPSFPHDRVTVRSAALSAMLAAPVTALPGILGLLTGQLFLFPSLGPTAVIQAYSPQHAAARPRAVIGGHLVGLGSAYLVVWALGIAQAPSVFQVHALSGTRVFAAVLAVLLGTFLEVSLKASHPPSASTTLLAALGSFKPTIRDTLSVVAGVLIVALAGESVRRLRLRLATARERAPRT